MPGISGIYEEETDVAFWAGGTLEDAVNNIANIILRMDGSGHLAKGNILWDAIGNLTQTGKFESNKAGNKITIDPTDRSLKFTNGIGQTLINMFFQQEPIGSVIYYTPRILLNYYGSRTSGSPIFVIDIAGNEVRITDNDTGYKGYISSDSIGMFNPQDDTAPSFGVSKMIGSGNSSTLYVGMKGLPDSNPAFEGQLYKDGDTVKIS